MPRLTPTTPPGAAKAFRSSLSISTTVRSLSRSCAYCARVFRLLVTQYLRMGSSRVGSPARTCFMNC